MPKMTYLNIKKTFFYKDIAISQQEILQGNHARKSRTFDPTQRKGKI